MILHVLLCPFQNQLKEWTTFICLGHWKPLHHVCKNSVGLNHWTTSLFWFVSFHGLRLARSWDFFDRFWGVFSPRRKNFTICFSTTCLLSWIHSFHPCLWGGSLWWEVRWSNQSHVCELDMHTHTHTHTHRYIYIYMHTHMYMSPSLWSHMAC